jgi:hypothetical protein
MGRDSAESWEKTGKLYGMAGSFKSVIWPQFFTVAFGQLQVIAGFWEFWNVPIP